MSAIVATLLGLVQGVFMFVPVSSTSHLALAQHWLLDRGAVMPDPESPQMILFDLVLHVGTLVSIVIVMRRPLGVLVSSSFLEVRMWRADRSTVHQGALHTVRLLLVATAVTGVLGMMIRVVAPAVFGTPVVIAMMLVITGVILWWTDRATTLVTVTPIMMAVGIGVAQSMALLPGLSRSGLTIAAALALGLGRPQAAEFSFVLAIPTILAATLVQALDVMGEPIDIPMSAMVAGFVVSAVVGVFSLWAVLRLLYAARFRVFSIYVWLLAGVVVAFAVAGTGVF